MFKNFWKNIRQRQAIRKWRNGGAPYPPPHLVKQLAVLKYAKDYQLKTLIETGTFHGTMIASVKNHFDKIISVELDENLFQKATDRFKNDNHIAIINGDSGKVLKDVIRDIAEPAIFWLDGHFSGGETARGESNTPIMQELEVVLDEYQVQAVLHSFTDCRNATLELSNEEVIEKIIFIIHKEQEIIEGLKRIQKLEQEIADFVAEHGNV